MAEKIETLLKASRVIEPTEKTKGQAYIKDYEKEYQRSIADPEKFWDEIARKYDARWQDGQANTNTPSTKSCKI